MPKLTIYGDLLSQPSRAVICFCQLTGIQFDLVEINPLSGAQFSPEFKRLNPMKLVPVLVVSDSEESQEGEKFVLTESHAILRYLATTQACVKDHWYPEELRARARVDEYLD